ncbi:NADAR family protein [Oceanobacter mangrovi]|uniref:NADAR family protein n=1 Tax=Oceanobacter mangrovi TaxID=2862510 RepID=UPI001C8EF625|nr:NADAR family protein [Oceanobacter mangrovi]
MFFPDPGKKHYVDRSDVNDPLSACSRFGFVLDDAEWPSVEHYYQGMKFESGDIRESIRTAENPAKAVKLAKANKRRARKDWNDVRQVVMTRAVYTKCRTHAEVAAVLLKTGTDKILENSMFDYYWGCGRDGRGHNTYGKVLMAVRDKLLQEQTIEP